MRTIISPNLISNKWRWTAIGANGILEGKASTEPEAWRLAKDAEDYLNRPKDHVDSREK